LSFQDTESVRIVGEFGTRESCSSQVSSPVLPEPGVVSSAPSRHEAELRGDRAGGAPVDVREQGAVGGARASARAAPPRIPAADQGAAGQHHHRAGQRRGRDQVGGGLSDGNAAPGGHETRGRPAESAR